MVLTQEDRARRISPTFADRIRRQLRKYERERVELMHSLGELRSQHSANDTHEDIGVSKIREEIAYVQDQIKAISRCLLQAEVLKKPTKSKEVRLGSTVKLADSEGDVTIMIVDSVETDPLQGKISEDSRIGRALLGSHVNQEVITPATVKHKARSWKITHIS